MWSLWILRAAYPESAMKECLHSGDSLMFTAHCHLHNRVNLSFLASLGGRHFTDEKIQERLRACQSHMVLSSRSADSARLFCWGHSHHLTMKCSLDALQGFGEAGREVLGYRNWAGSFGPLFGALIECSRVVLFWAHAFPSGQIYWLSSLRDSFVPSATSVIRKDDKRGLRTVVSLSLWPSSQARWREVSWLWASRKRVTESYLKSRWVNCPISKHSYGGTHLQFQHWAGRGRRIRTSRLSSATQSLRPARGTRDLIKINKTETTTKSGPSFSVSYFFWLALAPVPLALKYLASQCFVHFRNTGRHAKDGQSIMFRNLLALRKWVCSSSVKQNNFQIILLLVFYYSWTVAFRYLWILEVHVEIWNHLFRQLFACQGLSILVCLSKALCRQDDFW